MYLRLGLDEVTLSGAGVEAYQSSILGFGENDGRIQRIDLKEESVAAHGHSPVVVDDAVDVASARRAAQRVVVLRAAVHVVEGLLHVYGDGVKLGDG